MWCKVRIRKGLESSCTPTFFGLLEGHPRRSGPEHDDEAVMIGPPALECHHLTVGQAADGGKASRVTIPCSSVDWH